MTEQTARRWIEDHFGTTATEQIARFQAMLADEMTRQNLIAKSTSDQFWARHVLDSLQLIRLAGGERTRWVDVGTGAGFPGLVVGMLWGGHMTLIEPRRLRAAFLQRCIDELMLGNVQVCHASAEKVRLSSSADVISARAVGTLEHLLEITTHFTGKLTRFILPKGTRAESEIAAVRHAWHGVFHVEQSLVDPESSIIVAEGVCRR